MTRPRLTARLHPPALLAQRRTLIPQPPAPLVHPRPLQSLYRHTSPEAKANHAAMREAIDQVDTLRTQAREGGGQAVLEKWRARGKGKLSARERSVFLISEDASMAGRLEGIAYS